MANASCSTCTLVSNVLTLAGSVSGFVAVGMTITGAGVPAGVTITSNGTGSGGVGTYNCSASAANVTAAEPMVFSLSWDMPLQGNASSPQLLDLGRAAGFGFIVAASFGGGTAGPGQEYQFGAHAVAIYNDIAVQTSQMWPPSPGKQGRSVTKWIGTLPQYPEPIAPQVFTKTPLEKATGVAPLKLISAAPQSVDLTQQPFIQGPLLNNSDGYTSEYQFGTHANQVYDSQNRSQVFGSVRAPPSVGGQVPLRSIHVQGQELNTDLTIQGWSRTLSVPQGWIVTMIQAGPQGFDFTLEANLSPAQPFHSAFTGPTSPTTVVAVWQQDITQIPANISRPPSRVVKGIQQPFVGAAPDRQDYTQPQGQLRLPANPGPSKKLQPVLILALEQQYDKNSYPLVFNQPVIYNPPIIPPPQQGPPDFSVWTTDSTSITADTLNFTCDGADLINGGDSGAKIRTGGLSYTVSQILKF